MLTKSSTAMWTPIVLTSVSRLYEANLINIEKGSNIKNMYFPVTRVPKNIGKNARKCQI